MSYEQGWKTPFLLQELIVSQVSDDPGNLLRTGFKLWLGSQVSYDAIEDPDPNTVYLILG
jgi:hypothetical protein